jgi:hypothetical protein
MQAAEEGREGTEMGSVYVACWGCRQIHLRIRVDEKGYALPRCDACTAVAVSSGLEELYLLLERQFLAAYCDPDDLDYAGSYPECLSTSMALEEMWGGVVTDAFLGEVVQRLEWTHGVSGWARWPRDEFPDEFQDDGDDWETPAQHAEDSV